MNKNNHATIPSFISATAIQFRKRIKPISNIHVAEENNKQMKCVVPLDKYKFNILSDKAFKEALFVIVLYILFTFITAICIYYIGNNNRSFIDTIFETASTISNTGFSTGITNMDLDSISKLILSFNMIMGRFEIIAILYIFISKLRR
jgi:trk system potassium uptake protein TrkH